MGEKVNIALINCNEEFSEDIAIMVASEKIIVSAISNYNDAIEELKKDTNYNIIFVMENIANSAPSHPNTAMKKLVNVAIKHNQNTQVITASHYDKSAVLETNNHVEYKGVPAPDFIVNSLNSILTQYQA